MFKCLYLDEFFCNKLFGAIKQGYRLHHVMIDSWPPCILALPASFHHNVKRKKICVPSLFMRDVQDGSEISHLLENQEVCGVEPSLSLLCLADCVALLCDWWRAIPIQSSSEWSLCEIELLGQVFYIFTFPLLLLLLLLYTPEVTANANFPFYLVRTGWIEVQATSVLRYEQS